MPTTHLLNVGISLPSGLAESTMLSIASMSGRLGFATVHLAEMPAPELRERLVDAAAPAVVVVDPGTEAPGLVRVNDPEKVAAARAQVDAEGAIGSVRVSVPISIGRTMNEAVARADREPRFTGDRHPREVGIFGTFEQAQEQVLALRRAGADDLVLDVPLERDVADVLAQIRALVVGATPELVDDRARPGRVTAPRTVFYGS